MSIINKTSKCTIFDLETNGFAGASVLSVSALLVEISNITNDLKIIDEYNRYYFRSPGELPNKEAIRINGLSDQRIHFLRSEVNYPKHFNQDIESFEMFCGNSSFFVAHNISFDKQFVPFIAQNKKQFCTMKENVFINPLKRWPKLSATADFYGISVNEKDLHGSRYDTQLCFEILKAMYSKKHKTLFKFLK